MDAYMVQRIAKLGETLFTCYTLEHLVKAACNFVDKLFLSVAFLFFNSLASLLLSRLSWISHFRNNRWCRFALVWTYFKCSHIAAHFIILHCLLGMEKRSDHQVLWKSIMKRELPRLIVHSTYRRLSFTSLLHAVGFATFKSSVNSNFSVASLQELLSLHYRNWTLKRSLQTLQNIVVPFISQSFVGLASSHWLRWLLFDFHRLYLLMIDWLTKSVDLISFHLDYSQF